jgi:hypothetical protein
MNNASAAFLTAVQQSMRATRTVLGTGIIDPKRLIWALVVHPATSTTAGFYVSVVLSACVDAKGATGALLMFAPPVRPKQNGLGSGRVVPDHVPQQVPDFRHGQRQECDGEVDGKPSPRWRACGSRPDRPKRTSPG